MIEVEFKKTAYEEYMKMLNNKLNYRYPGVDIIELQIPWS